MGAEAQEFTQHVHNTLLLKGYAVDIDQSGDNFNKKIRNAQVEGYNYIGVIGKEELKTQSINLRKRDEEKEIGLFTVPALIQLLEEQRPIKSKRRLELEGASIAI